MWQDSSECETDAAHSVWSVLVVPVSFKAEDVIAMSFLLSVKMFGDILASH